MARPARGRGRAQGGRKTSATKRGRAIARGGAIIKPRRTPADGAALSPAAEETRNRLLDAGELEFGKVGYEGARLDRIALTVGVKTPLIHHYFNGKEALYQAVVTRALDALSREIVGVLERWDASGLTAAGTPSPEALRPLGETLVQMTQHFYRKHEPIFAILRQEARSGRGGARTLFLERVRPAFEGVMALLARLQATGAIRATLDPRHLFVSIVSMAAYPTIETLFVEAVWPGGEDQEAARAHAIVTLALRGMLT